MAEYKNGVNFRGNMSVEKNNVNADVQTGRAIFVDEDKYANDPDYKLKVDKCLAEGFHRVGESGGGGSSDFSTAKVTFINADTAHLYSVTAFRIDSDCMSNLDIAVSEPVTIEVPLYKGKAEMGSLTLMNTDFSYTPTATGGVSIVTDANMSNKVVITGDGTITAKGQSLG